MKITIGVIILISALTSCMPKTENMESKQDKMPIAGTWKLLSGTTIENGDTTVTPYTGNISFIKIINDTHFAFLQHDLSKGKDSTAVFVAGGGTYSLNDSLYTEKLEYCSAREWEDNVFKFTITIKNDTLIQSGVEKVESAGVDRLNIEKYIRVKN
jgi:predicted small secreted protein